MSTVGERLTHARRGAPRLAGRAPAGGDPYPGEGGVPMAAFRPCQDEPVAGGAGLDAAEPPAGDLEPLPPGQRQALSEG